MRTLLLHSLSNKLPSPPPPPAQPFEIVLARKITSKGGPLLRTFTALDGDNDGIVSKTDLRIGIQNLFNIDLQDDQIDIMFLRFVYINNLMAKGSSDEELSGMRYQGFVNYVDKTADSHTLSSDSMNGAAGFTSGRNLSINSTQSAAARRMDLRKTVLHAIQQNAQCAGDGGMAATYIFLGMDSLRNNRISREEFGSWLRNKMGLKLSDEELRLVLGEFWKEELTCDDGLTFRECVSFVECLTLECMDVQSKDENRESWNDSSHKGDDNIEDNINAHVKPLECHPTLMESDKEVVMKLREALHSDQQFQKDLFNELTKSQSNYLTEAELMVGINGHGIKASTDQVSRITKYFGNIEGHIEHFHFVKLLMGKI